MLSVAFSGYSDASSKPESDPDFGGTWGGNRHHPNCSSMTFQEAAITLCSVRTRAAFLNDSSGYQQPLDSK
jgi:hypothetical protein